MKQERQGRKTAWLEPDKGKGKGGNLRGGSNMRTVLDGRKPRFPAALGEKWWFSPE